MIVISEKVTCAALKIPDSSNNPRKAPFFHLFL